MIFTGQRHSAITILPISTISQGNCHFLSKIVLNQCPMAYHWPIVGLVKLGVTK